MGISEENLVICGLPFRIAYHPRNSREDSNMGACDLKKLEISIDSEMPEPQREATLCHEWIHAVLNNNAIEHSEQVAAVLGAELYRCGFNPRTPAK